MDLEIFEVREIKEETRTIKGKEGDFKITEISIETRRGEKLKIKAFLAE